jgi:MarR family transcriptional repressor of mepA
VDEEKEKPIGAEIRCTDNLIKTFIDQTLENKLKDDLTGIEGMTLGFIFRHQNEEITAKEVMARSRTSKATTSQTLNGLVKKGYLKMESSSKDKRKKIITLTPKGVEMENEFKEIFKEISLTVKKGITEEEEKEVRAILKKIQANINEANQ